MKRKAPLFALALCGGLAFALFSGGKIAPFFHHAAPTGPSSIAAGQERLRFDGLYQGNSRAGDRLFLRFYPEGDVVVLSRPGATAEQAADTISRNRQELGRGVYRLRDADVTFTTSALNGSIDYEGTISVDSIVLSIRSRITNFSDTVRFDFHPASFPSS